MVKQGNEGDLQCYSTDLLACSILRRRNLDETKNLREVWEGPPCMQ